MIERFVLGLVSRFGLLTLLVAGVVFFYEGVPLLRKIPFIDRIPAVGYIIEGQVHRYSRSVIEKAQRVAETRRLAEKQVAEKALAELEAQGLERAEELRTAITEAEINLARAIEAESQEPKTIRETVAIPMKPRVVSLACPKVKNEPAKTLKCPAVIACPRVQPINCLNQRVPDRVSKQLFRRK